MSGADDHEVMSVERANAGDVDPLQDFQPTLEFFGSDDGFPVATDSFRKDFVLFAYHPSRIHPVVEHVRDSANVCPTSTAGQYLNKWTSGAVVIVSSRHEHRAYCHLPTDLLSRR